MTEMEKIKWSAPEYEYFKKGMDWYLALWIIAISTSASAFLLNNLLFGILIIVGTATLTMYSMRKPETITVEVTSGGININHTYYPFSSLSSFWISEATLTPKLILKPEKKFSFYAIVPVGEDVDTEQLKNTLAKYLKEEHLEEPLPHKIMDYLGF